MLSTQQKEIVGIKQLRRNILCREAETGSSDNSIGLLHISGKLYFHFIARASVLNGNGQLEAEAQSVSGILQTGSLQITGVQCEISFPETPGPAAGRQMNLRKKLKMDLVVFT